MEINLIDTLSIWKKSGEMNQNEEIKHCDGVNLSQTYKTFLWLWSKCGTTHMKTVLDRFDFKFYQLKNNKLSLKNSSIVHEHNCIIFPEHENYKLLAAIRNPYSRFFSEFVSTNNNEKFESNPQNKDKFSIHLENILMRGYRLSNNCCDFFDRKPDYPIRVENLFEDYSKIPFIVDSDYYKSGRLEEITKSKINDSNNYEGLWKNYYTQQTADMVYYRMPRYFEIFGYDKNSWHE
jgi:hypothetical protein